MSEPNYYKTVLILGAGASYDLGIPLGNTLIDHIISNNKTQHYPDAVKRVIYNCRKYIRQHGLLDYLPKEIAETILADNPDKILYLPREVYTDWTKDLHYVESIDQFIHHRKDLQILGKINILLSLAAHERPAMVDPKPMDNHSFGGPKFGVKRTWYNALWNNIIAKNPPFEEAKRILSEMHFVTFNYDRSLEFYLLRAFKAIYPDAEVKSTDLPITHIYGSLGSLDPEARNYRAFANLDHHHVLLPGHPHAYAFQLEPRSHNATVFKEKDEKIFQLAMGIDTYGKVYDSTRAEAIQGMIRNAKHVYIFGFSFQYQNMDILFNDSGKKAVGHLDGTCYDMANEKLDEIRPWLRDYFSSYNPNYLLEGWKGKTIGHFFKDYSIKMPEQDEIIPSPFNITQSIVGR